MRAEIIQAVENAKNKYADKKNGVHPEVAPGEMSPDDYSFVLSKEQKSELEQFYKKLSDLKLCLQRTLDTAFVHIGTSTSLEIQWQKSKAQVVLELSLCGPLVAVFVYEKVLEATLQQIDQCLSSNGLMRLSDEEKEQLENQGVYHQLF